MPVCAEALSLLGVSFVPAHAACKGLPLYNAYVMTRWVRVLNELHLPVLAGSMQHVHTAPYMYTADAKPYTHVVIAMPCHLDRLILDVWDVNDSIPMLQYTPREYKLQTAGQRQLVPIHGQVI